MMVRSEHHCFPCGTFVAFRVTDEDEDAAAGSLNLRCERSSHSNGKAVA